MVMHNFYPLFFLMSTLVTFCLYFVSKSVLINSVHHFWPKMSDSARIVHPKTAMSKQSLSGACTLSTLFVFSVYTCFEHTVHTVHTTSTVQKCHWVMHLLTMLSFSRTLLV